MSEKFRIVLEDELLPVQLFFNTIPDRSFIDTLNSFRQGVGAGFNDAFCGFPGEEDFNEEPLNGIEFAIKGEEVILDYDNFFRILNDVCKMYVERHPSDGGSVSKLLASIKEKLNSL